MWTRTNHRSAHSSTTGTTTTRSGDEAGRRGLDRGGAPAAAAEPATCRGTATDSLAAELRCASPRLAGRRRSRRPARGRAAARAPKPRSDGPTTSGRGSPPARSATGGRKAHGKSPDELRPPASGDHSDQRLKEARLDREAGSRRAERGRHGLAVQVLPDPTPPSRRLKPAFARQLARISARNNVDWALTLAVLRSSGERGAVPASKARLLTLTKRLQSRHSNRNSWSSVLALEGRTTFADRDSRLAGPLSGRRPEGAVKGFDWAKPSLSKRILNDRRISIYPGGRADIQAGRVNIRVLDPDRLSRRSARPGDRLVA